MKGEHRMTRSKETEGRKQAFKRFKMLLIMFICTIALNMTGCAEQEQPETVATENTIEPFIQLYISDRVVVFVDTHTKVMYACINNGHGGTSMIALLNADGTPRLYEGESE